VEPRGPIKISRYVKKDESTLAQCEVRDLKESHGKIFFISDNGGANSAARSYEYTLRHHYETLYLLSGARSRDLSFSLLDATNETAFYLNDYIFS